MFRRLLLAAVFAALGLSFVLAQDTDPYQKKVPSVGEARVHANEMRDGKRQVLKTNDEAKNKADLLLTAKALVYPITDRAYYFAPEPNPKKPTELAPIPAEQTLQARLDDLDRYILKPTLGSKLNFDQWDYIVEFGAALDTVTREILTPEVMAHGDPPPYLRVNAARVLSIAAQSGAPTLANFTTELIENPKTPPEVLVWALQAAKHLLAAYDPRQENTTRVNDHTINSEQLVRLVKALESVVNRQTPYYGPKGPPPKVAQNANIEVKESPQPKKDEAKKEEPKKEDAKKDEAKKDESKKDEKAAPPVGKLEAAIEPLDEEDARVIRFVRRQAIRALAQVRFPMFEPKVGEPVRPLFTLCRVAVNDGPFVPPLGPEEYGDAVQGLFNLKSLKGVDFEAVQNCMALGTMNFASKKTGGADRSITWIHYGKNLNTAAADFQKSAGEKAAPLVTLLSTKVFTPLEQGNKGAVPASVNLPDVQAWLQGRSNIALIPFLDLKAEDKARMTLKPVLAKN